MTQDQITSEEATYRLETAKSISTVAEAVAGLRGELIAFRWTMGVLGTLGTLLLGAILTYLVMRG